jgi:hypothetical protein
MDPSGRHSSRRRLCFLQFGEALQFLARLLILTVLCQGSGEQIVGDWDRTG